MKTQRVVIISWNGESPELNDFATIGDAVRTYADVATNRAEEHDDSTPDLSDCYQIIQIIQYSNLSIFNGKTASCIFTPHKHEIDRDIFTNCVDAMATNTLNGRADEDKSQKAEASNYLATRL